MEKLHKVCKMWRSWRPQKMQAHMHRDCICVSSTNKELGLSGAGCQKRTRNDRFSTKICVPKFNDEEEVAFRHWKKGNESPLLLASRWWRDNEDDDDDDLYKVSFTLEKVESLKKTSRARRKESSSLAGGALMHVSSRLVHFTLERWIRRRARVFDLTRFYDV